MNNTFGLSFRLSALAGIASLVIGALVAFNVSPLYSAYATIQIGHIGYKMSVAEEKKIGTPVYSKLQPIESQRSLGEVLRGRYRIPDAAKNQIKPPYLYNIELRVDGVVNLFARGSTPEEAERFLSEVVSWIIERHDIVFDSALQDIRLLKQEFQTAMLNHLGGTGDDRLTEGFQVSEVIVPNAGDVSIASIYRDISYSLLPYFTNPTKVILEPTAQATPLKPKPVLYLITVLIISIFSTFITFVVSVAFVRIRSEGLRSLWLGN